jgi:hypothetical protein
MKNRIMYSSPTAISAMGGACGTNGRDISSFKFLAENLVRNSVLEGPYLRLQDNINMRMNDYRRCLVW